MLTWQNAGIFSFDDDTENPSIFSFDDDTSHNSKYLSTATAKESGLIIANNYNLPAVTEISAIRYNV